MSEELINKFRISGGSYYDRDRQAISKTEAAEVTVTNVRLIIEYAHRETRQIFLHDIIGIESQAGLLRPKMVRVHLTGQLSVDVRCNGRGEVRRIIAALNEAIVSQVPE